MTGYGGAIFPQHAALLEASAISPEVARDRGYVTVDTKKRLESPGFKDYQRRVPGLLIPIHDTSGAVATWHYRPDSPRATLAGKTIKYETPGGSRLVLDVPPRILSQLGDPLVPLWITEGARKADAAVTAGVACIGLSGVDGWQGTNPQGGKTALADWKDIALNGRRVYLAFDSDAASKPSVAGALQRLGGYLSNKADVRFCYLPDGQDGAKTGLDDYLAAGGSIDALIKASTPRLIAPVQAELPAADVPSAALSAGAAQASPAKAEYDEKERLIVKALDRNPVDVADDVAEHLLGRNDPPHLFRMGSAAVELKDDGSLVPLDPDGWLAYVSRRATFKAPRIVAPPGAVMKLTPPVLIPQLPSIDGVAATPYLDRDGNVVATPGYNPATRLVLHTGDFRVPAIPAEPGGDDVAQAVKLLTEEWLGDFPFATPADKANALAVVFTLTGRMFFALAPLFVVDASTAGSGKGLLVATISLIATGASPQVMELPADGEEQRKKITSALLAGHELIMWDESHVIQGRTLAAILTAETYSDRLLGGNKMISVRNRFTQVALGNNVEVWGDMKRRVVPSRLVPDTAHPEARTDFRHPDLETWVRDHRGELLAAVLTIWRNWIARGRPESPHGMGSFDRWARAVGGALQAAGIEGFRTNTAAWLSDSDDDDGWTDHLAQLRARFGDTWFTPADVESAVRAGYLKDPPVRRDPEKTLSQQLPYSYRKIRERWHGDLRLVGSSSRNSASGGRTWSVQQRAQAAGSSHSGTAEPSSVSSVSSVGTAEPQVTASAPPDDALLTMRTGKASSVGGPSGISAGQSGRTDDTDDTDDEYLASERDADLASQDVCNSCGRPLDSFDAALGVSTCMACQAAGAA